MLDNMKKNKKKALVFYHEGCSDGFGAAWAAWKKLGSKAEYVGLYPNDTPKQDFQGRDVYLVDICFNEEVLMALKKVANSLTVIDHHKTNVERVKLATVTVFDLKHSGAILSWNFFHPGKKAPQLLRTIEDIDIWNWKLPFTDEIVEYSSLIPMKFLAWSKLAAELDEPQAKRKIIEAGKILIKDRKMRVEKMMKIGEEGAIDGHKAFIVNSPITVSHIGNYIYEHEKYPVAIIWSRRKDKIAVSLRSNGKVDVSTIAQKFGGGGHRASAAFTLPPSDFATVLSFYKG